MAEQLSHPTIPVHCKLTEKTLVMLDKEGLQMWCRACKTYHTLSWANLQRVFQGIEHEPTYEPIKVL
jgi:hypothetical protein